MEKYRQELVKRERQIEERIEQSKAEQRAGLKESVKALSLYDNHPADLGTASYERELDEGLIADMEKDLRLIEEALERIDEGHYGICLSCGQPISSIRLKALPQAPLCAECKRAREELREDQGFSD